MDRLDQSYETVTLLSFQALILGIGQDVRRWISIICDISAIWFNSYLVVVVPN